MDSLGHYAFPRRAERKFPSGGTNCYPSAKTIESFLQFKPKMLAAAVDCNTRAAGRHFVGKWVQKEKAASPESHGGSGHQGRAEGCADL